MDVYRPAVALREAKNGFQRAADEAPDKEVWMLAWVDEVDEVQKPCVTVWLEITFRIMEFTESSQRIRRVN